MLSSPPLAWLALAVPGLSLDAPYAPGITRPEHAAAIRAGAAHAARLPEDVRGLAAVALVDRNILLSYRVVSLSRAWWRALADAISASPDRLERRDYDAAIRFDQSRMTTAQMIGRAAAVEVGGRV